MDIISDGERPPSVMIEPDPKRPRIALHCCCAPCSTSVLERLAEDWTPVAFFYNPNIRPRKERDKRADEMLRLAKDVGIECLEGPDDEDEWRAAVRGLEKEPEGGGRCRKCIEMRLARTRQFAAYKGIDRFTTTLSVSPHKNAAMINEIGRAVAAAEGAGGPKFLEADFKKKDGYKRSLHLSKVHGLYRQNYCGCLFGKRGGGAEK